MPPRSALANIDTATVTLTGTTPLVMDSIEHADPDDRLFQEIKKITDKKDQMTAEDQHRKDRLAYISALYVTDGRLVVQWASVRRALSTGAFYIGGTSLSGKVGNGISCAQTDSPLDYGGPEPGKLYDDEKYRLRKMVNKNPSGKKAMVVTVRPIFPDWSVRFDIAILNDIVGYEAFERAIQATGATVGIGNARKLGYGRFRAVVQKTEPS